MVVVDMKKTIGCRITLASTFFIIWVVQNLGQQVELRQEDSFVKGKEPLLK